jgi:LuxR family maltose regulon positive regulatory protein
MASVIEYSSLHRSPIQPLRPHIAADIVARPRLLKLLEHGASLTLVVAPAGYGKTSLIANWLDICALPSVWVTFDAEVTDLHRFLTRLLPTMSASLPHFNSDALQELSTVRTLPPLALIVDMLHDAFAALDQEVVLVLDDYHAVTAPKAHTLLTDLLHLPPTPLRLVLASRYDPPLPLIGLRAHGQLIEIRSRDLNFTSPEVEQFLADSLTTPLSAKALDELVRGTEGWAASLRLAQLFLRQEQGFVSLARALEVGARHAREFLAEEVFAGLPPAIQTFLMQVSILERLSASACAAVTVTDDPAIAQANLRWLAANGVFTVPIDDAQEYFRCHALLRQLATQQLHTRCGDEEIAALHRRASRWFAAEGYTEEAIRHALTAGDVADAVNILARVRHDLMKAARWMDLSHLLHLFPAHQIEREPELLLAQAWFARSQNNIALLQASLQLTIALLNGRDNGQTAGDSAALHRTTSLQGEVEVLQSHLCYWRADMAGVVAHTRRSLTLLPLNTKFARGFAVLSCVTGCQATGEQAAAYALLDRYAGELHPEDYIDQMHWMTCRIVLYALEGDLSPLAATADAMLQLSVGRPWSEPLGLAHYFRAIVHYWRNELADIEPLALAVLAHRYQSTPRYVVQTACILALAYQAQGRAAEANAVATAELLYAETNNISEMQPYLHALQADLALRQGNVDAVAALLRETAQTPLSTTQYHYTPHLALLRLYLQQNTAASLDAAGDLLARLERFWTAIGHAQILLELLVLKALYWRARGQEVAALETLAQAVHLADPHGNIRIFADLGLQIDDLLAKLQQIGAAPLLVAAARAVIAAETPGASRPTPSVSTLPVIDDLAVLLTFREQEVLQLLGEHLTNQEIAARLSISTETVKRHSISIFRKLDVKNRRAAALYARQLAPA